MKRAFFLLVALGLVAGCGRLGSREHAASGGADAMAPVEEEDAGDDANFVPPVPTSLAQDPGNQIDSLVAQDGRVFFLSTDFGDGAAPVTDVIGSVPIDGGPVDVIATVDGSDVATMLGPFAAPGGIEWVVVSDDAATLYACSAAGTEVTVLGTYPVPDAGASGPSDRFTVAADDANASYVFTWDGRLVSLSKSDGTLKVLSTTLGTPTFEPAVADTDPNGFVYGGRAATPRPTVRPRRSPGPVRPARPRPSRADCCSDSTTCWGDSCLRHSRGAPSRRSGRQAGEPCGRWWPTRNTPTGSSQTPPRRPASPTQAGRPIAPSDARPSRADGKTYC
jgi:hypothetical protein